MKGLFEEYGDLVLTMVTGTIAVSIFLFFLRLSIFSGYSTFDFKEGILAYDDGRRDRIVLFEAEDMALEKGKVIDTELFKAENDLGEDISAYVCADKNIDTNVVGTTKVVYTLMYNGEYQVKEVTYQIYEDESILLEKEVDDLREENQKLIDEGREEMIDADNV